MRKIPKFLLAAFVLCAATGCSKYDSDFDQVIPKQIVGIQAVNVDNAGEYPRIAGERVLKNAYMIGITFVAEHTASPDDEYVSGPVPVSYRGNTANSIARRKVLCINDFNASIPAGSNVSRFFKEVNYLPQGIDEGLVLLVSPTPGDHSFRVIYETSDGKTLIHDTPVVNLY